MKTITIHSAIPDGFGAQHISVESDIVHSLNSFFIVGMPNRTVEESRERIRSAIRNSKFTFPSDKVIINLAPAELQKTGS